MKRFRLITAIVVASFCLMMIGCAKEPVREMSAAKAAVDSAKAAQADLYLADQFTAVDESLKAALADIEKQKAGPALKRNYDKAKASLVSVAAQAADLKAKAAEEKAHVQADVESGIAKAGSMLADAKNALKKPAKGKKAKAAAAAAKSKLAGIETQIKDAQAAQGNGDFLGARDKINAAIAAIGSLKAEPAPPVEKTAKVKAKTKTKAKKHKK
jgi:hypothetical protein